MMIAYEWAVLRLSPPPRMWWRSECDGERWLLCDVENDETVLARLDGSELQVSFLGVLRGGRLVETWGAHEGLQSLEFHHPKLDGGPLRPVLVRRSWHELEARDYLGGIISRSRELT